MPDLAVPAAAARRGEVTAAVEPVAAAGSWVVAVSAVCTSTERYSPPMVTVGLVPVHLMHMISQGNHSQSLCKIVDKIRRKFDRDWDTKRTVQEPVAAVSPAQPRTGPS